MISTPLYAVDPVVKQGRAELHFSVENFSPLVDFVIDVNPPSFKQNKF